MPNIRFFSKLAFICNLCFLIALIVQKTPLPMEGEITATVILIGYLFAGVINLVVNMICLVLFFSKKLKPYCIQSWLLGANFLFLIPELFLLLR